MSDKPKFSNVTAMTVAASLCASITAHCERLTIAGSIRRRKSMVGDIELLYVPGASATRSDPNDMFATVDVLLVDEAIAKLEKDGVLERRRNVNGSEVFGPQNKLMCHKATGIPVDLFSTTLPKWWVALVVRTGSKNMNLKLTTGAHKLGRSLNAYGVGVTCSDGTIIPATSEEHVFELCGEKYREPWERNL